MVDTVPDFDISELVSRETCPARKLELDEFLAEFLDELEPIDRQLITKRLQGYTTAEVARELDVEAGALRLRLFRLRKSFQGTFQTAQRWTGT